MSYERQRSTGEAVRSSESANTARRWNTFVALGDSFTEGLNDPTPEEDAFRGWADRLASILAGENAQLRYANLAVRGKLLDQILAEQLPAVIRTRPDLAAFTAGGNDIIRPFTDPDELAQRFDDAVTRIRATGADVLIGTGFDTRRNPVMRLVRGKVGTYNSHLWAIAQRHGCYVVDLWSMQVLHDQRAWSADRLHLSAEGHRRVTLRAAEALGLEPGQDWRAPWPPERTRPWAARRGEDLHWVKQHLGPWIGRRIRGTSSGDGRKPKRPEPQPLDTSSRVPCP